MLKDIIILLAIPLAGTTLGATTVFFLKNEIKPLLQKMLMGFAAGVMVAASVWSLLIPAIEMSQDMGKLSFIPAAVGFCTGIALLLLIDNILPHMHVNSNEPEGINTNKLKNTTMLMLAVTLHNFPEGMAVGVVVAGFISGETQISYAAALALALGIAIQNFPEGAVISLPMRSKGDTRFKAFRSGMLSGVVEPIGSILTILFTSFLVPILPYILAFAAGTMMYVVVEELIPEATNGKHTNVGTIAFAVGFVLMMILDVALS